MELEAYPFDRQNNYYAFVTKNADGNDVPKIVAFSRFENNLIGELENELVFNMSLLDYDISTRQILIDTRSRHHGLLNVFLTVAKCIEDFLERNQGAWVYIIGATPTRTRLFRQIISNNILLIRQKFSVLGIFNGRLLIFDKNIDFESFLIKKN